MKYIRFVPPGESVKIGILLENCRILPLQSVIPGLISEDMIEVIRYAGTAGGMEELSCLDYESKTSEMYDLDSVKVLVPIERPVHDIICVGVNYEDHLKETKEHLGTNEFQTPLKAVYFSKRAIRITGPGEEIISRPDLDEGLDYEVELAVIIGKTGKNIPAEKAEDYIFGYSVFNDISFRNLQTLHGQWFYGKSLDTCAAMGPVIAGKEEFPFPVELAVKSVVNGELRQHSNTRNFIHDIPSLISELSEGFTLECGDIIATGTPSGVGMGFAPPRFMKKGDTVTCEIEGIGKLTNSIS